MKVSVTKKTTKKDLTYNNHLVKIEGYKVGAVGRSWIGAENFTFFSHCEETEKFDGKEFDSPSACKLFFQSL